MIISEKQILELIAIAERYAAAAIHSLDEHKNADRARELVDSIHKQQSEELKMIE